MYLKSLELIGFKSFAKRTVLTFEPGVTAVVGPNGSGKSNIADAIRWVLGAQSKKAVRGKVASDVIFSGTGSKAAMSLAEVSLTFDNSDKKLPYEFAEVVVTRRLYRSGESEYLVNGSPVRLTDLQHAMAVAGVGAENYTVISQGMVDRVLSQSPRERRGLFEEAAGVRQFYLKRDESRRKLSETSTNLSRLEDILKELEPRLKGLRKQASVLAQAETAKTELQEAYLAKYGAAYRALATELAEEQGKRDEVEKEYAALTKELEALSKELSEKRQRQQGLTLNKLLEEREALRNQRDEWQAALNQAITAREVSTAKRDSLETARDQFKGRLSDLNEHAGTADEPIQIDAETSKQIQNLTKELADLEADYQAVKDRLGRRGGANVKDFAKDFSAAVAKLTKAVEAKEYGKLPTHLKALQKLVGTAGQLAGEPDEEGTEETSEVLSRRDTVMKQLHDLRLQQAAQQEAVRLRQAATERQRREVEALTTQLKSQEAELAQAEKSIAEETSKIERLTRSLSEHKKGYQKLEAAITKEQQQGMGDVTELAELEQIVEDKRRTGEAYRQELSRHNVELARLETRLEALTQEAGTKLTRAFPPAADSELPAVRENHEAHIEKLERRLLEVGGIDPGVAAEHEEVAERFEFLSKQAEDLRSAKADLERVITQLERKSQTLFREAFVAIDEEFGKFFATLFGGGKAALQLLEEPTEEDQAPEFGIDIAATPPGKRLQSLAMLSGGERALTAVALLFAILKVNPSPFVMLDEADAALDEANTARFADLVKEISQNTQFVVVTHNRDTMKSAETLYGVTMDETGISTLLSLKLPEAEKVAVG